MNERALCGITEESDGGCEVEEDRDIFEGDEGKRRKGVTPGEGEGDIEGDEEEIEEGDVSLFIGADEDEPTDSLGDERERGGGADKGREKVLNGERKRG